MALNSLGLGILISARDEASQVFKRVQKSFVQLDGQSDEFVKKMKTNGRQMASGLALMGIGVTGLKTAFAAANEAGRFEAEMTNLRVISHASTKQMNEFREAILGADRSMFGPIESAEALRLLTQRGFTARQAMEMLVPVTNLASASLGQLGLSESAEAATIAIHGFQLKAEDTARVTDEMARAATMSGLAFKELPMGIGAIARGAQAANQSFEESIITLGMMRNSIHSIERASNAGSVAMERLVAGTKGSKELQAMVNVFDKATGQVRPFRNIVNDLIPKLDTMGVKASKAFIIKAFGTRGLAGIQAMVAQLKNGIETADGSVVRGIELINYQNQQISSAAGTAARMAEEQMKTLPGQIQLVKSAFEKLLIVVGTPFAEALEPITRGLLNAINFVKHAVMQMPASMKKGLAQFFLLGSALATVIGVLMTGSALMTLFGVTFSAIAASAISLLAPLLAIGAAIGGVILMVKAFQVHAEQAGGGVIGFFTDMARKVGLAFQGLMQLFQEGAFSGQVMLDLNKAENKGVKAFAIKIYLWAERIKNFLAGMWDGFSAGIRELKPTFDMLVSALGFVASAFGLTVGPANDNLAAWKEAGTAGQSLGQTLSRVAGIISEVLTAALLAGVGAVMVFNDLWKGVGPVVMGAASMIWGAVQIIAGVLSGDWTMAWKGAINMVYGLLGGLVHILGFISGAIAGIFDGLNRIAGIKSTFASDLKFGIKEIDAFLAANKTEALNMAGVKSLPAPSSVVPAPTATTAPAVAAARASVGGIGGMINLMQNQPAAQPQIINLTSVLKWDNETLAKLQQQIKTDADARGFTVGAHP